MAIEILFSFDTTGSMYPCLSSVRSSIKKTVDELFASIKDLKIGIIAHGDYCDRDKPYITKHLKLTDDKNAIEYFVNNVERTHGGDAPECYELVLHEAVNFNWTHADVDVKKLVVVIGDSIPHAIAHNPGRLDWKIEAQNLVKLGIVIHGIQCLNNRSATDFYRTLAEMSGGAHVPLSQFSEMVEIFKAIVYGQDGNESLDNYEQVLVTSKKYTRTLQDAFAALSKRDPKTGRFRKVDPSAAKAGRFQIVDVDNDLPIKDLVESIGAEFERGRGFYEFTKRELIQGTKQIVLMNKESGDMYEDAAARKILGLPESGNIKMTPSHGDEWMAFVQSTSNNRKLIGGTKFLYEIKES